MKKIALAVMASLVAASAYASPVDIHEKTLLTDFASSRTADSR